MSELHKIYSLYDMVCEAPSGGGVEIVPMPSFFDEKKGVEADYVHVHNFYEIVWFREGDGIHYVDFNEYPIQPNTVFCISPGQIHAFDKRHNQSGVVMKVCSGLLEEATGDDAAFRMFNLFSADDVPYHLLDEANAAKLDSIISSMQEESQHHKDIGHIDYLKALLRMLIITVERGSMDKEHKVLHVSKTSHKMFLAFRKLLEENFRTKHTVKDYALMLNISTKTLTTYVTECTPQSPLEIINARITIEAKRMLRYSDMMVKEIGYMLGFEDASYFVKFFKRQTGILPVDFREGFQKTNEADGMRPVFAPR